MRLRASEAQFVEYMAELGKKCLGFQISGRFFHHDVQIPYPHDIRPIQSEKFTGEAFHPVTDHRTANPSGNGDPQARFISGASMGVQDEIPAVKRLAGRNQSEKLRTF